jgi:hypothetical protein
MFWAIFCHVVYRTSTTLNRPFRLMCRHYVCFVYKNRGCINCKKRTSLMRHLPRIYAVVFLLRSVKNTKYNCTTREKNSETPYN